MKIRLAVLEPDKSYLSRVASVFNAKYADKLEIYSFTEEKTALAALEKDHIDVFLANEAFAIDKETLPERCGFAYLVEMPGIESLRGENALCKFQKAELIYKKVLGIFSDQASAITGMMHSDSGTKMTAFFSAAGGCGCTTAAAAYAAHLAGTGKKVLYLNLETFGNPDMLFQGEGQGSFGDIIYAVKSRKGNLYLKIESSVKRDPSGVYFFSGTSTALDMNELKEEEKRRILTELKTSCDYECVVLDLDFSLNEEFLSILDECAQLVLVSDGSRTANEKTSRMLFALNILEQQSGKKWMMRMGVLYNRFSSATSEKLKGCDIREIGGIRRYEGYGPRQLVRELSALPVFDRLE